MRSFKATLLSICLLVLLACVGVLAFGQANKNEPPKQAAPQPITLKPEEARELQQLYADTQRAQITGENLSQLLVDSNSPCFRQVAETAKRDYEAKVGRFNARLAGLRDEYNIPKGYGLNVQNGTFDPPR